MRLYFDVCCLHRPLDDQTQERIRIESEAVRLLLSRCAAGVHTWVCSEAVMAEVLRNPDEDQRLFVETMIRSAEEHVTVDDDAWGLAESYSAQGLGIMDALHVVTAEHAGGDVPFTTDEAFLRCVGRLQPAPAVQVANPARWLLEQESHGT